MYLNRTQFHQVGQSGNIVAENISSYMVGMIVRYQGAYEVHLISFRGVDNSWNVPRRINRHAYAFLVVAYQINKVCHLRCKVVSSGKIAAREKLFNINSQIDSPLQELAGRVT